VPPGFEAWFFGVLVRDWLFTGASKGLPGGFASVGYPLVNSEYFEWIGLLAAVAAAEAKFTTVEVGAGWGRWLVASAKLAAQRGLPFTLAGVEADRDHFRWMQEVFRDNGLNPEEHFLTCAAAAPSRGDVLFLRHAHPERNYGQRVIDRKEARRWKSQPEYDAVRAEGRSLEQIMAPFENVDFLAVDVGGIEAEVLSRSVRALGKVRVLQVKTAHAEAHERVAAVLAGKSWVKVFDFRPQTEMETPFGTAMFHQGLQTWRHPEATGVQKLIEPNIFVAIPRTARAVWIDAIPTVETVLAAQRKPSLMVYAFEPDLDAASRLRGHAANVAVQAIALGENSAGGVRLDHFLEQVGIDKLDLLRVPGLDALRTAGSRLRDVKKIEVATGAVEGAVEEIRALLRRADFEWTGIEASGPDGGEMLTFAGREQLSSDAAGRMLRRSRELFEARALTPNPGWRFDSEWDRSDAALRERRAIWEAFRAAGKLGPLEVEWYGGARLTLYLGNDLSKQLFVTGCFEPNEFAFLSGFLKPGMVFVDAGANEGLYSIFAAGQVGELGRVYAFEPSPREFRRLERNLRLNQFPQLRIFSDALSAGSGISTLSIAREEHGGQNTLGALAEGVGRQRGLEVATRSLDDIAAAEGWERIDVLKMDVEGEEIRLLAGASRVLRTMRPVVLFECSAAALARNGGSREELLAKLQSFDYSIYCFDDATGLPVAAGSGEYGENMIAAPVERPVLTAEASERFFERPAIASGTSEP